MALGKENRSKHGPQICGQFRRKSVQHSGVLELARLALGIFFFFYLCDPDLVNFIQSQYSHMQDGTINSPVSYSC